MSAKTPASEKIDWENLHRVLARTSLIAYIRRVAPWFTVEEVHCIIAGHLEAVADGDIDRLMLFLPPRTGKSSMSSIFFPSWWAGRYPSDKIMQVGHSVELSRGFSLNVREIIQSDEYKWVFPGVQLSKDAKAAGRFRVQDIGTAMDRLERGSALQLQGQYTAAGRTSSIAGKGWNLGLPDDVMSEQDKDSKLVKDRIWNWWGPGFYTRRQPERNAIVLTMCMTGDTPVTMGNGTRRRLDKIKLGDVVQAWDNGVMRLAKIKNWKPSGVDDVFEISTGNSKVRANARHPFLVKNTIGEPPRWVRLSDLKVGDTLVQSGREAIRTKPAIMTAGKAMLLGLMFGDGWVTKRHRRKVMQYVTCCATGTNEAINTNILDLFQSEFGVTMNQTPHGYVRSEVKTLGYWMAKRGIRGGAHGKRLPKWLFCQPLYIRQAFMGGFIDADGYVGKKYNRTTIRLVNEALVRDIRDLARGMGLRPTNVTKQRRIYQPPGSPKPIEAENFSVEWQNTTPIQPFYKNRLRSIRPAGCEMVYDIEVETYGNFIADGLVVHNTRWAPDDLAGHLLDEMGKDRGADTWTVLNVPAILDGESAKKIYTVAKQYGQMEDLRELKQGDSFAPRRWSYKELMRSKAQLTDRDWEALYMGNPKVQEGHILKTRFWRLWPKEELPVCDFVFSMYDTAFDEAEANDMSARTTWGIFPYLNYDGRKSMHMILLDAWEKRVEAPDLKGYVMAGAWGTKAAREGLLKLNPDAEIPPDLRPKIEKDGQHPDRIMIENKASGIWLIKELRRIRNPKPMPIWPWNAPRGGRGKEMGKYARAIFGSLVLEQGAVWYPNRNWAVKVIDQCAECKFDGSDATDDLPDTVAASMIYVRQTYRVDLESDRDEEDEKRAGRKPVQRQFYGAR